MAAVEGLRSPYDKTAGGLHHLGRMLDKMRLRHAGRLPDHYHGNYGQGAGLDSHLCGFLNVEFKDIEARLLEGGSDAEITEWIFARGLRPTKMQTRIWNEFSRKFGWNDLVARYLEGVKKEAGLEHLPPTTAFDLIELTEDRVPPAGRG